MPNNNITTNTNLRLGVAFDLGSTTIVGALIDPASGEILKTHSLPNPQGKLGGADILSRIKAVSDDSSLLRSLHKKTIAALDEIIERLCPVATMNTPVGRITIAGNSVMTHILLNISPEPLGKVPYRPVFKESRSINARELGFNASAISRNCLLESFPLIGGFIGGDTVAMMLSLGMEKILNEGSVKKPLTTLAVDIGTNSEIVLSTGGQLFSASAAAGPAFEGGGIESGMTAERGAIRSMEVTGDEITLDVIGNSTPKGICGSGLVNIITGLLNAGVIEASGRIKGPGEIDTNLSSRIKPPTGDASVGNSFLLFMGPTRTITLSQSDVRSFQTAKGAIRAGISVLMEKAGIKASDIDIVYIAGAFGSNLSKEGLERVGLLDVCWQDTVRFVGDAALDGAIRGITGKDALKAASKLSEATKYVSLSGSPGFERAFIQNMNFF